MAVYVYWFILAAVLLGIEMTTGTFYLLVLSVAMAVGGVAAMLGFGLTVQLVLVALSAVAGWLGLYKFKGNRKEKSAGQNLDIGQTVRVVKWGEHGKVRVHYRGAEWDAELEPADAPRDGALYIKSMRGSLLVLSHDKPAA